MCFQRLITYVIYEGLIQIILSRGWYNIINFCSKIAALKFESKLKFVNLF